jgi:hypothetical protein
MRACAGLVFGIVALICGLCANAQAQQSNAASPSETFESAFAKARQECMALWSDRTFDPLRKKLPLLEDKPTLSMLTNKERLQAKDRPLADLAIKTVEKCRNIYAPVYSMLPQQMQILFRGVDRKQDALIAELYSEKITFGDYNVAMNRIAGEVAEAIAGVSNSSRQSNADAPPTRDKSSTENAPSPHKRTESSSSKVVIERTHETRLALVIGNSNYASLPKLSNPSNDARSIAEILQKMGYRTQLVLDGSDQSIRNEFRKFANESKKADVALLYYAGHGAQLNGSNYILPIDMEIPHTDADIQFAGLKVDDLVNSIRSNTKIVFLDACRDNPALFKNIVKGRGGVPIA